MAQLSAKWDLFSLWFIPLGTVKSCERAAGFPSCSACYWRGPFLSFPTQSTELWAAQLRGRRGCDRTDRGLKKHPRDTDSTEHVKAPPRGQLTNCWRHLSLGFPQPAYGHPLHSMNFPSHTVLLQGRLLVCVWWQQEWALADGSCSHLCNISEMTRLCIWRIDWRWLELCWRQGHRGRRGLVWLGKPNRKDACGDGTVLSGLWC